MDRLQLVLKQNKELALQVSDAFDKARSSILEYLKVAPSDDRLSSPPANETPSGKTNSPEQPAAGSLSARDVIKNSLLGDLLLNDGTERGYTLDTADLRKPPVFRSDYGLSPAAPVYEDEEDYSSFQYQAQELLSKPIQEAREVMQQALDAETEGLDTTEYTDKVIEILREPLQQVQELYDSLSIGGESGEGSELDFSDLSARVDEFLKESAKKKLSFSADASDLVSTASSALSRVRSMVENANLTLHVKTEVEDPKTGDDKPDAGLVRLATGGRFSSPTHAEIAEDGDPEYVIPVKKEDEALPLVRSLLSELSASARDSLRDLKQFRPWMARILTNQCKDLLRTRKRWSFCPLEEAAAQEAEPAEPVSPVFDAVKKLKPELSLLVTLHYVDGCSMQDLADDLGIPVSTVKTRLRSARKQIGRTLLVEWEEAEK